MFEPSTLGGGLHCYRADYSAVVRCERSNSMFVSNQLIVLFCAGAS